LSRADGVLFLELAIRLGLVQVGFRLVEVGLVGARVDLEEEVALLDLIAFLERGLGHVARHAGANIHRLDRIEPAGEVLVVGDFIGDRRGDDDFHGLFLLPGCRSVVAPESTAAIPRIAAVPSTPSVCADREPAVVVGEAEPVVLMVDLLCRVRSAASELATGRRCRSGARRRELLSQFRTAK